MSLWIKKHGWFVAYVLGLLCLVATIASLAKYATGPRQAIIDPAHQVEACVNGTCIVRLRHTQCLYRVGGGNYSGNAELIHCVSGSDVK